jgi:2-(1,2-epoxy-1,2-dihydrophenyl)acetyl-CoA isomerase
VWTTVPEHYNPIVRAIATMPKPVIAAVNGIAAGAGASFAFASDFRIMADTAAFNLAFAGIGLTADSGASWTLPRLVGQARATELLMRPSTVHATEALTLGLATSVVPLADLPAAAHRLATELANGPTVAYAAIKRSLAFSAGHGLEETLELEAQLQAEAGVTADHVAAVQSFVAKEKPTFHGR